MSEKHYNVYVIALDKEVLKEKKFVEANPNHDPEKVCFYVGMTGLTPDERFENHKKGIKANKYVQKYGQWLRRRKYERFNPMTYEEAQAKEKELAEWFRRKGHAVWQN